MAFSWFYFVAGPISGSRDKSVVRDVSLERGTRAVSRSLNTWGGFTLTAEIRKQLTLTVRVDTYSSFRGTVYFMNRVYYYFFWGFHQTLWHFPPFTAIFLIFASDLEEHLAFLRVSCSRSYAIVQIRKSLSGGGYPLPYCQWVTLCGVLSRVISIFTSSS